MESEYRAGETRLENRKLGFKFWFCRLGGLLPGLGQGIWMQKMGTTVNM